MGKFGFSFSWKRLLGITGAKQSIAIVCGVLGDKPPVYL
jgi:hypothetical protein